MSEWINLTALTQVLGFGLLVGAGLPILFAAGVRLQTVGAGSQGSEPHRAPNRALTLLGSVCFAVVLAAVVLGVLFVARDFIGHHTGTYILGAEPK